MMIIVDGPLGKFTPEIRLLYTLKASSFLLGPFWNNDSSFVMAYRCHDLGDKQWGTIGPSIDKFNSSNSPTGYDW